MCGIAGYWNHRSGRPADPAVLASMVGSLSHRGPDEEGCWVDGSVALGSRRLQVIDPLRGHQPMSSEDGTVRVVFNGEIYNHEELRRELERRGHRFVSDCDTEVLAHGYEEWGPSCVDRLNGMFAIAAWDRRARQLFLARDRLGIKPLYIHEGPEGVVFGSEIKAVVAAPWVPVEWDLEAVDDFMTYEYVPAPRTIVRGVEKLPAGTWRLYGEGDRGAVRVERYWWLSSSGELPASSEESAERLRERLRESVRKRLAADVPLGVFLSGGIDSSIVVGLMRETGSSEVRSFSLGFDDATYDELPYARLVSQRFRTRHEEERVSPGVVDLADRLADYFDEPFGDVSAFPTFMISRMARRHVTVALSGDGGDELFAGYDQYRADRWARRLAPGLTGPVWAAAAHVLDRIHPTAAKKGMINKAKRFAEGLRLPPDLQHARWWVFLTLAERGVLYSSPLADALRGRDPFDHYRGLLAEASEQGFDGLQAQLYSDIRGYLADDILVKVDRMSMAVSLEARVPYLDHEVVECAMSIPDHWKLKGRETKWILKRACGDLLPPEVRRRGKEGFSIPMKNWLRGPLRPMMLDLLSERRMRQRGWFEPVEISRLVHEHLAGHHNHAHRLWCAMSLELSLEALSRRGRERLPQSSRALAR